MTAGDETAATGGVMYTDEGELEFDEDEMAALEGQRLVAELFPDSGSESDFECCYASEPAGNLSGGDDSGSEAVTESDDDEGVTGHLSDAAAAAAYRTNLNPLDARRRLTDISQTSYAAGSRLTYKTVNQCSGS